jgi:hypothetical protein
MGKIIFTAVMPPDPTSGERNWVVIPVEMWEQIQQINNAKNGPIIEPPDNQPEAAIQWVKPTDS